MYNSSTVWVAAFQPAVKQFPISSPSAVHVYIQSGPN